MSGQIREHALGIGHARRAARPTANATRWRNPTGYPSRRLRYCASWNAAWGRRRDLRHRDNRLGRRLRSRGARCCVGGRKGQSRNRRRDRGSQSGRLWCVGRCGGMEEILNQHDGVAKDKAKGSGWSDDPREHEHGHQQERNNAGPTSHTHHLRYC